MVPYVILFSVLFVIAAAVAYGFFIQASALKSKEGRLLKTSEDATTQAQKALKELETNKDELTRRRAEAADLREKLNDLRSRQHKQRESDRRTKGGAEAELTEQLSIAQRRLEDEQSRVDVLTRESEGMQTELARIRDSHKKAEEALKAAQAAATRFTAASEAPTTATAAPGSLDAPVPAAATAPTRSPRLEELERRVEQLDRQAQEARKKRAEGDEEVKRLRSKVSTANRNHLLVKSELNLFKEKLVWSEKRVVELERLLFDNKIALPERETAPAPKAPQLAPGVLARESANTSGEGVVAIAADYVPEETPAPAVEVTPSGNEPPSPASAPTEVPAATESAAPSEPQSLLVEEPRPEPVPPIRRPRALVEGREEVVAKSE